MRPSGRGLRDEGRPPRAQLQQPLLLKPESWGGQSPLDLFSNNLALSWPPLSVLSFPGLLFAFSSAQCHSLVAAQTNYRDLDGLTLQVSPPVLNPKVQAALLGWQVSVGCSPIPGPGKAPFSSCWLWPWLVATSL